jgi:hypothetical protein
LTFGDPGQGGGFVFAGDVLFFTIGDLYFRRIKVYAPDAGLNDFVSFGNDVAANAADLGTDGKDMVWTEAFGRAAPGDAWTTINIMTAPFTADPSKLQKRRLRSEIGGLGIEPYTVGCGYAAHYVRDKAAGQRLVRLSDGRSWRLKGISENGFAYAVQETLAITCEELFFRSGTEENFNVARVRLDSLGPGEPAD